MTTQAQAKLVRSVPQLAQDALDIQNACNLSGVAHAFSGAMSALWTHAHAAGMGTEWINTHPITIAYVSKLVSLARCEEINTQLDAFNACEDIVKDGRP